MITPLFDRVVLKEIDSNTSTLYVPQDDHNNLAVVVAVGNVKCVKVDDKVIFNTFATTSITVDGQKYLIIKEVDIVV